MYCSLARAHAAQQLRLLPRGAAFTAALVVHTVLEVRVDVHGDAHLDIKHRPLHHAHHGVRLDRAVAARPVQVYPALDLHAIDELDAVRLPHSNILAHLLKLAFVVRITFQQLLLLVGSREDVARLFDHFGFASLSGLRVPPEVLVGLVGKHYLFFRCVLVLCR